MKEHLLIGQIGQFSLVLYLLFSLASTILYSISFKNRKWLSTAHLSFYVSALGVLVAFICLYIILQNHYYEYKYAYDHSNNAMSPKFLLAAIWEGQEGSFLIWGIWNSILGIILSRQRNRLSGVAMISLALAQFCLSSMVIGWIIGGKWAIGSTPFILFKEAFANIPFIVNNPDSYLQFLKDGTGLNPLLQNYWMVIHPPVLFLGFAATIVPFGYAIAGMLTRKYRTWNNEAMPWAVFAAGILGLGILMGAAWAYEALSFGGYWAWDPVENASLVPWLTLVAGVHTMIIYKATGRSMRLNVLFFLLSFVLVLYSTFLTRSGILGDTSVHAFTDLGMNGQLLLYLCIFMIPALVLYFMRYKKMPSIKKEESTYSREFWMFVGSLVLLLASVHITFFTSIPVWNKIFGSNLAPPIDTIHFYNKIHIWFAIVILILSATVVFLRFKRTNNKKFWKTIAIPGAISLVLALVIILLQKISGVGYILMALASSMGIVFSIYYILRFNRKDIKRGASAFTHMGFAILLLGVLVSSYNKKVISLNKSGIDLNMGAPTEEENRKENGENLLLFRQVPTEMNEYVITYLSDSIVDPNHYYNISYERFDDNMKRKEDFILQPNVQFNPQMGGIISNPDTRHYLTKDIYTYITKAVDKSQQKNDTLDIREKEIGVGDTAFFANGYAVLKKMERINREGKLGLESLLRIFTLRDDSVEVQPVYLLEGNKVINPADTLKELELYVRIKEILINEDKLAIEFAQPSQNSDFVVIKSIVFPYINLVWLGAILMTLGFGLSTWKRIKSIRRGRKKQHARNKKGEPNRNKRKTGNRSTKKSNQRRTSPNNPETDKKSGRQATKKKNNRRKPQTKKNSSAEDNRPYKPNKQQAARRKKKNTNPNQDSSSPKKSSNRRDGKDPSDKEE